MIIKWLTTYLTLCHAVPYEVQRSVLHFMLSCDFGLGLKLYTYVRQLLEEKKWLISGHSISLHAFANSEVVKHFRQNENDAYKIYPNQIYVFGYLPTPHCMFHISTRQGSLYVKKFEYHERAFIDVSSDIPLIEVLPRINKLLNLYFL